MNSIVIFPEEVTENIIILSVERWNDIKPKVNSDTFKVGILGRGTAEVSKVEEIEGIIKFKISNLRPPLPRLGIKLIVGLSRPQTVKKVISTAAMLGVSELHFVATEKGEKSYIQATILKEPYLSKEIHKALEQSCDCISPVVEIHKNWRWFIDKKLPNVCEGIKNRIYFDISKEKSEIFEHATASVLFFGPEAGLSDNERFELINHGFKSLSLGERVLRVEVAVAIGAGIFSMGEKID